MISKETAKKLHAFTLKQCVFASTKRICFTFNRIIVCKSHDENIIVYGYRFRQTTKQTKRTKHFIFMAFEKTQRATKGKKRFGAVHRAEERSAFTPSYLSMRCTK